MCGQKPWKEGRRKGDAVVSSSSLCMHMYNNLSLKLLSLSALLYDLLWITLGMNSSYWEHMIYNIAHTCMGMPCTGMVAGGRHRQCRNQRNSRTQVTLSCWRARTHKGNSNKARRRWSGNCWDQWSSNSHSLQKMGTWQQSSYTIGGPIHISVG